MKVKLIALKMLKTRSMPQNESLFCGGMSKTVRGHIGRIEDYSFLVKQTL